MDDIPEIIKEMSPGDTLESGIKLFEKGAVLDISPNTRGAAIRLISRPGKFESVQLTVKFESLQSKCSCGISISGTLCVHGVAAALAYRKAFRERFDYCFDDCNGIDTAESSWAAAKPPPTDMTRSALKKKHLKDMVRHFEKFKGKLVLRTSVPPKGESRWHQIKIKAELQYETKIFSSNNIRRLLDMDNAAGGMNLAEFPPQDQMVMRYLTNQVDRKANEYVMNAHNLSGLFHCLAGFTRFFSGDKAIRISPNQVSLVLEVRQEDKGYLLKPSLKVQGQGLLNLKDCSILAGVSGYWIGFNYEYFWLAGVADIQWISGFLTEEELFLNEHDFTMLRLACEEHTIPVSLDLQEKSSNLEQEDCVPLMNLDWNNGVIRSTIFFRYGNYISVKSSSDTVWNGTKFVVRDQQVEEEAYIWLTENKFEQMEGAENTFFLNDFEAISQFLLKILPELNQTWDIYYSENFSTSARYIKPIQMKAHTEGENQNWVELDIDFLIENESINQWQAIFKAVRNNQDLVLLDNGDLAQLDDDTKRALNNMPELETLNKGKYRFSRYMSLMMNNVLSGCLEEKGAPWREIQTKLLNAPKEPSQLKPDLDKTLREYQKDGIAWLQTMKDIGFNCVLADEMGLGKTIQALSLIESTNTPDAGPSLVICPKSLIDNWYNEAKKFVPNLSVKIISGAKRDLKNEKLDEFDILITSYALIRRDVKFYESLGLNNLILDEAQNIKNHASQTSQCCRVLDARFKLVLSGTPVENSLRDIWSIFDFILPGLLGSIKDFKGRFELDPHTIEEGAKLSPAQELATRIRPFILRRHKKDLLKQLPPKQEQVLYCELNEEQKGLYAAIASEAGTLIDELSGNLNKKRFTVLAVLMKLRQACCHPSLVKAVRQANQEIESAKFELLKELLYEIRDSSRRVLVFSQFTSMLKIIATWLSEEGIKFEYLDGASTNRQDKVDRFNGDDTIPVFLLSLKAGGTGLNLTGADTVIHYDMWWNPQVEDQATDRTHRIGQKKSVNVIKLVVKGTIEEKILELQQKKRKLFENIMDGIPTKLGDLDETDLRFLLGE
ncbi:MAG: SNF2 family helicase [Lentisphaeraceae bacterium]|nr:SNF2 family helicase [Lentisphaeraceae bacterium]